ncbi:MAG: hypothetical protein ACTSO9_00065 [Candidatus Helarchaeota archaeon]
MSIIGVRRRKVAEESSELLFQTSKAIISRFRRESDKEKIYSIVGKDNTLTNLLIGSAVIHLFYYSGIRTINPLESVNVSVSHINNIELMELKNLFEEFKFLIKDTTMYEIKLIENKYELLGTILDYIKESDESIFNEKLDELREKIVDKLTEILQKFPYIMFFDFIGSLLGYTKKIKEKVIKETSELKIISQELEKEIIEGGKKDSYLELTTLNILMEQLKKDFEFKSKKELQSEAVPLKKIALHILKSIINKLPTSKRALNIFYDTLAFNKKLISKFSEINNKKTNYDVFENEMISLIKNKITDICQNSTSNHLIYFLQFIMDKNFSEIVALLNRFGLLDFNRFAELFKVDKNRINQLLKVYGIQKIDLLKMSNPSNDPLKLAEIKLFELKKSNNQLNSKTISDLFENYDNYKLLLAKIANLINWKIDDLYKYYRKKKLIQKKFIDSKLVPSFSYILLLFDYENAINNVTREIYFSFFSNITKQISRILETYIKLKEDIGILLLGLKRIQSSIGVEQSWVVVKIEELMIQRIMKRQEELSLIFNAENDPFLVNGFILAKYTDSTLKECKKMIETEPSLIYQDVKELPLPPDMISPISYCIAYDILERYKIYQERAKLKVEQVLLEEKLKKTKKKEEVLEAQKANTLNWIERRITSSIMRITSKGINPTTLYWAEKDTLSCRDNMLLHTKNKKSLIEGLIDYYNFALNKMKELWPKTKVPDISSLKKEIIQISANIISKRLKKPIEAFNEEIINDNAIEGEKLYIAEEIAKKIGKKLDKILYKKFKQALNESK